MDMMQPDELRVLRRTTGLTQDAFARVLGMSRKAVNAMEGGKAVIERRTELAARYVAALSADERDRLAGADAD